MKDFIYELIERLSKEKEEARKHPVIVLDKELQKEVKKEVLNVLRELRKEKKVDFGRTINNNFVEIRKPDAPPRNRKVILHEHSLNAGL